MARSHWLKAAALVGCLFIAVPGCKKENATTPGAAGGAGGTTATDTSSPKATAKSLSEAMKKGDTAAVKSLLTGTDAQMKSMDTMVPVAAAMIKLQDAAEAKYGKDNAVSKQFKKFPDPGEEAASGEEKIDGDHATITPKATADDAHPKPMKFVKKDGKWLMELDTLEAPPAEAAAMMAPMTKAANDVTEGINAGKYPKAEDALTDFNKKMMESMSHGTMPSMPHLPTTGPALPH